MVHEYSCQEGSQCCPDLKKNPSPGHGEKAEAVGAVPENGQDWQDDSELIFPEVKAPQQTCAPSHLLWNPHTCSETLTSILPQLASGEGFVIKL